MFGGIFASKQKPWTDGEPIIERIRRWQGDVPLQFADEAVTVRHNNDKHSAEASLFNRGSLDEAALVSEFTELIRLLMQRSNEQARLALYEAAVQYSIISVVDTIMHELNKQSWWQPEKMRPHARWFVNNARHREPLRFGIAMLGLSGTTQDLPLLRVVAKHDDFTIYAAIAVANLLEDPVDEWWQMALHVSGWGKVHLVKRLARRADARLELQSWLLRQGYKNDITAEYVAHACATAGRLDHALAGEADDELLDAGCTILSSMINAGPAENLEDYEGGVTAITNLLAQLTTRCSDVKRLYAVCAIRDWVASPEQPQVWERREEQLGWSAEVREEVVAKCNAILLDPRWTGIVIQQFRSHSDLRPYIWHIAGSVGVDLNDEGFRALEADPNDDSLYHHLLRTCTPQQGAAVVALAERQLNFAEIVTGPTMAVVATSRAMKSLDHLLMYLRKIDSFNDTLVSAALRCSATRLRASAVELVLHIGIDNIGDKTRAALQQLKKDEPDIKLRARLQEVAV